MTDCHTLLVSDIHIGSKICRTDKIHKLLETARYKTLIINGDLFDSGVTKAFSQEHWQLVTLIAKIARTKRVLLVGGNHGRELDGIVGNMGIEIKDDHTFTIGQNKFLCMHGDQFDPFVTHLPRTSTAFANLFYVIQKVNGKNQASSMLIKRMSKRLLGMSSRRQQAMAIKHANQKRANVVICSHTHIPRTATKSGVLYINSGSFCENPSTYVTIDRSGNAKLEKV